MSKLLPYCMVWVGCVGLACSGASPPAVGDIQVRDARAQLMSQMGAVYLTVTNTGAEDDRLLGASTPIAAAAELHESFEENGVMRMRARPDGFVVPAGGELELAPSGKHMMLVDPRPLDGVSTIPLTLTFEKAGAVEVEAAVLQMGQPSP